MVNTLHQLFTKVVSLLKPQDLTTGHAVQGNDISVGLDAGQGVIFEGLLAVPPDKKYRLFQRPTELSEKYIREWKPNELALKALIDTSDRLGVSTEVYTFLPFPEEIERWIFRKGVSLPVFQYTNVEELAYDLRFKHSIRRILVPTEEQANIIGMRATVVDPQKAWTL
jgi:hypothetical protein